MNWELLLVQTLNGVQYGLLLFLIAGGLTLIFGILNVINLAHGSFYMIGAYLAYALTERTGNLWLAILIGLPVAVLLGLLIERLMIRFLYTRDHLSQVLGTFAILLMCNEAVRWIWGSQPVMLSAPDALAGPVELLPGFYYPAYRLLIIGVGLVVAFGGLPALSFGRPA